jgi:type III restriction enzyme
MSDQFFAKPILNSPYHRPTQHWELDKNGLPTQNIIGERRSASFITPIPRPRKQKAIQQTLDIFDTHSKNGELSLFINNIRDKVEQ